MDAIPGPQLTIGMFSDTYVPETNGVVTSIVSTVRALRRRGHRVIIVGPAHPHGDEEHPDVFHSALDVVSVLSRVPTSVSAACQTCGGVCPTFRLTSSTRTRFSLSAAWARIWPTCDACRSSLPTTRALKITRTIFRFTSASRAHKRCGCHASSPTGAIASSRRQTARLSCFAPMASPRPSPCCLEASTWRALGPATSCPMRLPTAETVPCCSPSDVWAKKRIWIFCSTPLRNLPTAGRTRGSSSWGTVHTEPNSKQRAGTLGIGDRVVFLGALEQRELGPYYRNADLFVFTSITETQGLVIVEALAHGLPVVAVDCPVSREIIVGDAGLLTQADAGAVRSRTR